MSTNTLNIDSATGVPLTARLVLPGMGYGNWYRGKWALSHDANTPMVEFFDQRYFHSVYGQFISRYFFPTLDQRVNRDGLLLDTGSPDWIINEEVLELVLNQFRGDAHAARDQSEQGLRVFLATRDNTEGAGPDQPVPYGPDDLWWPVQCLDDASNIVRQYAAATGIEQCVWAGGRIEDAQGEHVGDVNFEGGVFDPAGATMRLPAHVRDFPTVTAEAFFEATGTRSAHTMPERAR